MLRGIWRQSAVKHYSPMKIFHEIIALSVLFAAPLSSADAKSFDTDKAYILIRATVADEAAQQPTWIALYTGMKTLHVPAGDLIVELNPGSYAVVHIDFHKSKSSGRGTQDLKRAQKFTLTAGRVYLVGNLVISKAKSRKTTLQYGDPVALLTAACKKSPEFFKHLPLDAIGQNDITMVPCEKLLNE